MCNEIQIQVNREDKGQRLDVFLAKNLKDLSRSRIKTFIKKGYVFLDGRCSQPKLKLNGKEIIKVAVFEKKPLALQAENLNLDIIFEDRDIIVINKSAGMVMYPGAGHDSGTLANALLYHFPKIALQRVKRPGIVHRLDKETSGVIVLSLIHI